MSFTAAVIKQRVQSSMSDESKTFIKDQDVYDWIYDAQVYISANTECTTAEATIFSVATQELYSYDNSFLVIRPVWCRFNNNKLQYTTLNQIEQLDPDRATNSNNSTPTHFYIDGGQVGLWPRPNTSGDNIRIRARVVSSNTITSDSSTVQLPDFFRELVFRYCMLRAREKDEQPETYQMLMQDFNYKLATLKNIIDSPNGDTYSSVNDIESGIDYYSAYNWC